MADEPTPTTARRALGAQLRQLRQDRELTIEQVAERLGAAPSTVSRLETGDRAVSVAYLDRLIRLFDVDVEQANKMIELGHRARRRREAAPALSVSETDYVKFVRSGFVELERDAFRVREFNSGIVPGLLQAPLYMRALMRSAVEEDDSTFAAALRTRTRRQERLNDRRGIYSVIVDEAVLARVVGGVEAMKEQMSAILRRIDESAVEFRVIPFDAGIHPGLNSVFVALRMDEDAGVPDTVFIEGLVGHQALDRVEDVRRFEAVWTQLAATASSLEASRALVERYSGTYQRAVLKQEEDVGKGPRVDGE